jgi:DNA polymerase-1
VYFAFDLETFLIQPGKHVPKGVCFSWATGETEYGIAHLNPRFGERAQVRDRFYDALTRADAILGANIAFDMAVMGQEFPELWPAIWAAYRADRVLDIQLNEQLIAIAKGELKFRWGELPNGEKVLIKRKYDLATLVHEHLGVVLDKDTWRLKYGTLYETPIAQWETGAVEYSLGDALGTWKVFESQFADAQYLKDGYRQARAGWWIHLMAVHGFRVDGRAVDVLERTTREAMAKRASLLSAFGLLKPNGSRDTKAAAARMAQVCDAAKIEAARTPKGKVKLTEEVCDATSDPALVAYAEYSSLSNVIKKDVAALRAAADAGVPVQARFDVLKATGRTSSSGGKVKKGQDRTAYGFQLQNVRRDPKPNSDGSYPPTVRGCFVPRPGSLLCSIDYGQMELHAWAQVCIDLLPSKKSDLAKMLNAGIDVHCKLGALATGRTYEEVYANRKKATWAKDARQMSKAGNFGFPGGLSPRKFRIYAKVAWGVEITEKAAEELYEHWKKMLSEAEPYFALVKEQVDIAGSQQIKQVRSERIRGSVGFTDGANGYFQALAADCAKDAGFTIAEAMYLDTSSPAYGSRLVDFVHDEFLFEVPVGQAHEAALAVNELVEAAGRRWMPDCPPKSEPALMERWYKDAEAVYENGRLAVWRPKARGLMEGV